jgi:TAG lipase/steryl ester hydrolase/phospholipase A2/LPA acyltransferase
MAALKGIPSTWNCAANDNDEPTSFPSQSGTKQSSSTAWARTLRSAASVAQLAQEFLNGTPRRQQQQPQQPQQILDQAVEDSEDDADEARRIVDEMDDPVEILFACLQNAKTSQEYREYARQLDILEGNHRWKYDEESDECNMRLIRSRLAKLKEAHRTGDMEEMVRLVRSDLTRDLGGMCNARLYQHTWSGTKTLIEEYTEVVKYTIERIAHYCDLADPLEVEKILVDMKAARQSFGNTGLMLSGGGTLGMCHIGMQRPCRCVVIPQFADILQVSSSVFSRKISCLVSSAAPLLAAL